MTASAVNSSHSAAGEGSSGAKSSQATSSSEGECFSCRLIGSASLAAVGLYALNQSRRHQPGSLLGKRILGGVGFCFIAASYIRWTTSMYNAPK